MDAFRAVSAAETCPGNGDFNTDVPGYQSQPLLADGLSNATIRSLALELRQERVTRYLLARYADGAREGKKGDCKREESVIRAKEPERRALPSSHGTTGMVGILDGGIWKNETTRDRRSSS